MLELKRSDGLKVRIYGQDYVLSKPTVGMIESYTDDLEKQDTGEKFKRAKSLLEKMGLPSDITNALELDHLNELINFLMENLSAKKN